MISEEYTYKMYGYYSWNWGEKSSKRIIAICECCGIARSIKKQDYRDLCYQCSVKDPIRNEKIGKLKFGTKATEETRKKLSISGKRRYEDPEEHRKQSETMKQKYANDPIYKEKISKSLIKYANDPEVRKTKSEQMKKLWKDEEYREKQYKSRNAPEAKLRQIEAQQKRCSDPEERKRRSNYMRKYFEDEENRIRLSCTKLGITREEWNGFSENDWRNWNRAIYINNPFKGCHRHHITKTIVVCIPKELHTHVWHNLKTGRGMAEMNMLALQFVNGCYDE